MAAPQLTSCTLHKLQPFPWACGSRARGAGGVAEHEPEALRGHRCLSTAPDLLSVPQAMGCRWNNHRSPSPVPCGQSDAGPHRATRVKRNASVHIPSLASEAVKQMGKQSKKSTEFSQNASAPRVFIEQPRGRQPSTHGTVTLCFSARGHGALLPGSITRAAHSAPSPTRICSQTHFFTASHESIVAFALQHRGEAGAWGSQSDNFSKVGSFSYQW